MQGHRALQSPCPSQDSKSFTPKNPLCSLLLPPRVPFPSSWLLFFVVGNLEIICPTSNIFKVTLKFYAKMGSIKDRNVRDLTETEDIKMRWQEYTEKLYKKDLHDPDNHDGVITQLEPDILECEVKWALGSITMKKASGGDGISSS